MRLMGTARFGAHARSQFVEEGFGARPEADDGGARVAVDPAAPGAQKLDAAVRAWAAMRARLDSGEISEEEYLDWKRGFGKKGGGE